MTSGFGIVKMTESFPNSDKFVQISNLSTKKQKMLAILFSIIQKQDHLTL
jgi:hypothetical protein